MSFYHINALGHQWPYTIFFPVTVNLLFKLYLCTRFHLRLPTPGPCSYSLYSCAFPCIIPFFHCTGAYTSIYRYYFIFFSFTNKTKLTTTKTNQNNNKNHIAQFLFLTEQENSLVAISSSSSPLLTPIKFLPAITPELLLPKLPMIPKKLNLVALSQFLSYLIVTGNYFCCLKYFSPWHPRCHIN